MPTNGASNLPNQDLFMPPIQSPNLHLYVISSNQSCNKKAKYTFGNGLESRKWLRNMHLNIRSLGNKVTEIKNIVKEQTPHIFGLSECELYKRGGLFDEKALKVPGYTTLFPQSWNSKGYARILVYIKNSIQFEQVDDLQEDQVQSIWIRGGFKSSQSIYFCHFYREHTTILGNSMAAQRDSLSRLLEQWDTAISHGKTDGVNEIHTMGDMNLDAYLDRWLNPKYCLYSLSKMVFQACNINNYTQLVTERKQ